MCVCVCVCVCVCERGCVWGVCVWQRVVCGVRSAGERGQLLLGQVRAVAAVAASQMIEL